jgi:hypothetical protein
MAAKRDIDPAIEDRERAALVLEAGIETVSASRQRIGDIDGPARQY